MSIPGGSSNPYQQPSGTPHFHGTHPPAYGGPHAPGGFGPVVPAPAGGRAPRGGPPGWLIGIGAAALTSAVWAGALLATGTFGAGNGADLAGYPFASDLCATADVSAFENDYRARPDDEPLSRSARHDALDVSSCELTFEPRDADPDLYLTAYVTYELSWHKSTDPGPEFVARAEAWGQYNEVEGYLDYRTEPLSGLGDEAFVVFGEDTGSGDLSWAMLTVRDGWFEYSLSWSAYLGDDPDGLAERDRLLDTLRTSTEETLAALRDGGSGGSGGSGEDGDGGGPEGDRREERDGATEEPERDRDSTPA
ncbi:hypothetical protein [Streptomyces marincola]|uniref:hypothetical protein n=1 Tax=Streptomyces marincola TaxID=2878388 RepID=UPI001CF473EA|nr:hypothetical protein [Streptomyces marincola]UCM87849.1 hypothetical protein LC193_07720 [Streptomyces marincola]